MQKFWRLSSLLLISTAVGASAWAQTAGMSCVTQIGYPDRLKIPTLESWALGSADSRFASGSSESECRLARELVHLFALLQEKISTEPPLNRRLRGTHAKGVCLNGTFRSNLAADLNGDQKHILEQAQVFATKGELKTRFRFANASSRVNPDWNPDVRAVSLKIALPGGGEQDFAMNNVPRFQIDNLNNFVHVMELQRGLLTGEIAVNAGTEVPDKVSLFKFFAKIYGDLDASVILYHLLSIETMKDEDSKFHASYVNQVYYSTTAFGIKPDGPLAANGVVKFAALPCTSTAANSAGPVASVTLGRQELADSVQAEALAHQLVKEGKVKNAENYLSESLVSQIAEAQVCYGLYAQFLDEEDTKGKSIGGTKAVNLVEDPSIVWKAPLHRIGDLQIAEPLAQSECDDPSQFVSITEHTSDIVGIGQINRARNFAESYSWKNR